MKDFFTTLNLFKSIPPSTDEHELRNQRISTLLFIVLLIISLEILVTYTSSITITVTQTMKTPSFKQYQQLHKTYAKTLTCPCKKLSIDYENILYINYTLHQVCSSDFVTEQWIDYLIFHRRNRSTIVDDFRWYSPFVFQALSMMCQLIEKTIKEGLEQFSLSQYVSPIVTPSDLFHSQTETFIKQFRSTTTNNFILSIESIRCTTSINSLYSAHQSSARLFIESNNGVHSILALMHFCCALTFQCYPQSSILENLNQKPVFFVPGLYQGCYIVESIYVSTLECFYHQFCIDKLQSYFVSSTPFYATALNASVKSKYLVNSDIKELLEALMIEEWSWTSKYENYYNQCQPVGCTYSYESKNSILYIITATIGLIGGLITGLTIIVPNLVKFLRRKKQPLRSERETSNNAPTPSLWQRAIRLIRTLNLFPSVPPSIVERILRNQRISTLLFIVSLIISLIILLTYNSLITITVTQTMKTPSFKQYEQLYKTYTKTLICPCRKLSIDYKNILHSNYTLHQVCSSVFVTKKWYRYIANSLQLFNTPVIDFRASGAYIFQALDFFCSLGNETIAGGLEQFNLNQYVTPIVTPSDFFHSQIETFIKQLKSTTTYNFIMLLDLIQTTTTTNGLYSVMTQSYNIYPSSDNKTFLSRPFIYENCECNRSVACFFPIRIHSYPALKPIFYVPGMYSGCYMMEGLLRSTLECFYDQLCIDKILFYLGSSTPFYATALNASVKSKHLVNSTIRDLIEELMIEEWNWMGEYENYYNECHPVECTYSYESKNSIVSIITVIIGLIGGLITGLEIIIPRLVRFITYIIRRFKMGRIVPQISIEPIKD